MKNCLWYSYDKKEKYCHLFDECDDFSANNTHYLSGQVTCTNYDCDIIGFCQVQSHAWPNCLDKIIFVWDKIFFVQTKDFVLG